MQDDRVQSKPVEEREGKSEIIKLVGQDSTSDPVYQLALRRTVGEAD